MSLKPAVALVFFLSGWISAAAQSSSNQIPEEIQALLRSQQYREAEQVLQETLQGSPDWDVGHVVLGQIYLGEGRYALAERRGITAVRIRPSLDGFMVLAVATMHLGKLNESIEWLEKAANLRADHPEIYKVLGLNYARAGSLVESEKAFRRASELDPFNWELHYLYGRALYELRHYQESETALHQAIQLNANSVRAWTALGQTQETLHDPAGAEASYRKALELCGKQTRDCAWPLLQLGFLSSRHKDMRAAESYFRQAVAARPEWAKSHFYLGKTLASLGDFVGARGAIEAALRLDGGKSEYHYQISQVYRRLRDIKKAEKHLLRYQELRKLERQRKTSSEFGVPDEALIP